jgi:predicted Rossmann fold nucleotide-binding protein DprA/Smf involved in DNA uptake
MTERAALAFARVDLASREYPQRLSVALGRSAPRVVYIAGNLALLGAPLVGLLASREVDPSCLVKAGEAFQAVIKANVCVIGGWHSPLEAALLSGAGAGKARLGIALATGPEHAVIPRRVRERIEQGGAFALTHCGSSARRITRAAALRRNSLVIALSDVLLVPLAPPGSATLGAAKRAVGDGKPVLTLDLSVNGELLTVGAQRFSATTLATALAKLPADRA